MVKNPPANEGDARDVVSIPRMRRSPGVGNGNLLQYFCLENSMERGAWRAKELNTAEHAEHTTSKQTNKQKNNWWGTSLVVQWTRICLPMQGTPIWPLDCDDPTCHGATKFMCRNYWACAPQQEKPPQWEAQAPQRRVPHSPQLEKAYVQSNKNPELPPQKNPKLMA